MNSLSLKALPLAIAALILLISPSVGAQYTLVHDASPDDPMGVRIYELDNGLTVYLSENHETPRFYAEIVVRAGSKHDPAESTGLAHYLEHLLFKGTQQMGALDYEKERPYIERITELYEEHFAETDPQRRAEIYAEINSVSQEAASYAVPNEMDNLYNAMGSSHLNAHTSIEETVYKVSLPANRLEQWAIIESERFANPVFRLFHTELETVYEEKNRTLDNRNWISFEAMGRALYKVHPYGQQPTIGTVDHLKNPSLKNIHDYFETYYVPNNMAICISGSFDTDSAIALIAKHFGAWTARVLPEPNTWDEPAIEGVERSQVQFPGEEAVEIAFRTVPKGHPDEDALMVADFILDNATAGLINLNLSQKQLVRSATAYHRFANDFGSEHLGGVPKEGQTLDEVEALLLSQLDLLKRGEFDDGIIDAIVTDFKKNEKQSLESDMARVTKMRDAFIAEETWEHTAGTIARLEKISKRDVTRVAKKYFGDNYVVVHRIDAQNELPPIEKPVIDPIQIDASRQSDFAAAIMAMDVAPIEPDYVAEGEEFSRESLPTGTTFYYAPNPINDLFALAIVVEKGTVHDDRLSIAAGLADKSAAGEYSAEDLKKEWYRLGSKFNITAGEHRTTISLTGLDENLSESVALMMTVLTDLRPEQETLDQLVAITLKQREDSKKDPGTLFRALYNYHRWGDESPFLLRLTGAELQALQADELASLFEDLLGYQREILYTGSLAMDAAADIISQHHDMAAGDEAPPERTYRVAAQPASSQILFLDKETAQSQIRIEFADGQYDESALTGIELYNEYFGGGMSGIVFQELREARALAYSAGARYFTATRKQDENLMLGVIGCQVDKTIDALSAFIELFDNLPESQERFEKARAGLLNRYRTTKIGFRGVLGAVRSWEELGLEPDPRRERFSAVESADISDLMAFHDAHIKGETKLISIMGDPNRIDMAALAEIAPVTQIGIDDLFTE